MARKKEREVIYICNQCGNEANRWAGRCDACGSWNSFEESRAVSAPEPIAAVASASAATRRGATGKGGGLPPLLSLAELSAGELKRQSSGIIDIDQVLGGGFVPGSFLLLGGEPGVGKSTLLLEISRHFHGEILCFSGEESPEQIRMRAERLGLGGSRLKLSREVDLETMVARIESEKPDLVFVDSIQTVYRSSGAGLPGAVGQLRDAAMVLMELAKRTSITIVVTGHITKDGSIAGPKLLEHMVDGVFYFESDRLNHLRFLRAIKNRFGPVGEAAIFEMRQSGLTVVSSLDLAAGASRSRDRFGSADSTASVGRVFSLFLEGSRPVVAEVQALVVRSGGGYPRRAAEGIDGNRLLLLVAVLEKYLRIQLADYDIFVNLAGGFSSDEPALDLAIATAVASSRLELAIDPAIALFGEVGLSGEVRAVARSDVRLREFANLGFREVLLPGEIDEESVAERLKLRPIAHIAEIMTLLRHNSDQERRGHQGAEDAPF